TPSWLLAAGVLCAAICSLSSAAAEEPLFAPPTVDATDGSGLPNLQMGDSLAAEDGTEPSFENETAAEDQAGDQSENPAGALETIEEQLEDPVSERNFESDVLVLPVDHLLGDWCGWRTMLEDDGISPSVTFVSDMLGNPVGGREQGFAEADNLGVNLAVDLEKRYGWKGGKFLFTMSQRSGRSLTNEYIGNTFSTQQVFGGETFKVIDIAYEQTFGEDEVEVEIGRIAAGDDFLVSQYNYLFVQNGFCGNPVGIFFNAPGMSAYPNATWGTVVQVRPIERGYVMGGLYNGDATIRDINNHGLDMSIDGPPFAIAELAYERDQRPGDNGYIGNYKVGAWFDGNDFANLEEQAQANAGSGVVPSIHEGNYGFYGLFDQVLWKFSDRDEEIMRGLGVMGSALVSPDQSISQMPYFFNAAIAARGIWKDRPRDIAAFGVVFGEFSSDLRAGQRLAQQLDPTVGVQKHETVFEWTYIFRFRDGAFFFQPDVQYILDPSGTGQIPDALVVGSQVGFNF
ncbi:MAG: carbohydrate porin, partial [Pirellulales bacterium]